MKKVMILCHDFPPLNSVGAQRPESWLKYLPNHGIHPVVITRKWPEKIQSLVDKFKINGLQDEIIRAESHTIIKIVPPIFKRNQLIVKYGLHSHSFQRKVLTIRDLIGSYFNFKYDILQRQYDAAREYLNTNKTDLIIASGEPFILFRHAHLLSKEFDIPWIADYRDPWINNHTSNKLSLIHFLNKFFQKRWTSSCRQFTTVSKPLIKTIEESIQKKGTEIRNGFSAELMVHPENSNNCFELMFVGTLYDVEYIEYLTNAVKLFLKSHKPKEGEFLLTFVGIELNYTEGTKKIFDFCNRFQEYTKIVKPIPAGDTLQLESKATVLLNLIPGSIVGGITPVSLYEYLALKKPIINIETESRSEPHEFSNYIHTCVNAGEVEQILGSLFSDWRKGSLAENPIPAEQLKEYTRENQAGKFADLIHEIIGK